MKASEYWDLNTHWHMRPRAMQRIRTTKRNSYVPAEVLEAQAQVAVVCSPWHDMFPKGTVIRVHLEFDVVRHPWRGDVDNLGKLVLDALRNHRLGKLRDGTVLQGAGVYQDDRQIRDLRTVLRTVGTPAEEGVHLRIRSIREEG